MSGRFEFEDDKKSGDLYLAIGLLATCFAGLERQLIDSISDLSIRIHNGADSRDPNTLSYGETVKQFKRMICEQYSGNEPMLKHCIKVAERLSNAGEERNDVLHSEWMVFSDRYLQSRARKGKSHKSQSTIHRDVNEIHLATERIEELIFDLIELTPERTSVDGWVPIRAFDV